MYCVLPKIIFSLFPGSEVGVKARKGRRVESAKARKEDVKETRVETAVAGTCSEALYERC